MALLDSKTFQNSIYTKRLMLVFTKIKAMYNVYYKSKCAIILSICIVSQLLHAIVLPAN